MAAYPAYSLWSSRRGDLALKILFSMTCTQTDESETVSQNHHIDNLVMIKFKGTSKMSEGKMKFFISFSSSKHDLAQKKSFLINVNCKTLDYSAINVQVPDAWSAWQEMGMKDPFVSPEECYCCHFSIVVTVYEDKKETVLTKLYTDGEFTDFNLATSEGSVPVHKACLAAHSDVFKAMLTKEWKETKEGQINMKGVTIETLQQLKDYMYLGTLSNDGLRPLLLIARCYLIEDLEKQCIKKLAETVTGENLFSLIEFACDNNIPELSYAMLVVTQDWVVNDAKLLKDAVLKSHQQK